MENLLAHGYRRHDVSTLPKTSPIPARVALSEAMRSNAADGHENLGFLSEIHGFMPETKPLLSLPTSHSVWDDIAQDLPTLYRSQSLRRRLEEMPELKAGQASLDDSFILRASVILSIFAHAYVRVEKKPSTVIPLTIQAPWMEITRRLKRPEPFLSYMDLIVYNWKVRSTTLSDPMRVENLDLLVPTVNNQEERVFYLTQVEILAQASPIVASVVRAQEAVQSDEPERLMVELEFIREKLNHITKTSLLKINPRPSSKTYVNPIVWAKTVAPFAVPIKEGVQGPSGTSSPIFHLMDIFLGRDRYDSILGRESLRIREWYPLHLREFLAAVEKISVPSYVANKGSRSLSGSYEALFDAYSGVNGFLGVHRRKVYGYLQMAFKVGRSITIGGFHGLFEDRTWSEVDQQLEETRKERLSSGCTETALSVDSPLS